MGELENITEGGWSGGRGIMSLASTMEAIGRYKGDMPFHALNKETIEDSIRCSCDGACKRVIKIIVIRKHLQCTIGRNSVNKKPFKTAFYYWL